MRGAIAPHYYGVAPGWGGELREKSASGWESPKPTGDPTQQFAKDHFEQHGHAVGTLKIEGSSYDFKIDGLGLRDHSWVRATGRRPSTIDG